MKFEWYCEITKSDDITQGDIVKKCPIPILNGSVFDAIIKKQDNVDEPIGVIESDVMILSQACDIVNDKIDSIVVCPVWPLKTLMSSNDYYKKSSGRENLRQGKEPSYHLLNEYFSEKISLPYSVVDFHRIYSLPKVYLKRILTNIDIRIRLLPPYREHLSQAFARYFMRVGLPLDIDSKSIKSLQL